MGILEFIQFMAAHNGVFWACILLLGTGLWVGWNARDLWKRVSSIEKYIVEHSRQYEDGIARLDKLESLSERLGLLIERHDKEIYGLREAKHEMSNIVMAAQADIQNLKAHRK